CDELARTVGEAGDASSGGSSSGGTWLRSPCLGLCEQAPAAMLTVAGPVPFERSWGAASASSVARALATRPVDDPPRTILPQAGLPQAGSGDLILLARVGRVDPASLDEYRDHGGYEALRRAFDLGPAGTVREVTDAKLVGRGGAAFP